MAGAAVEVPTADGVADAYLATPGGGSHGGVLLLMDAFGLRPQIERMADRIAAEGYVVLAPNLFYRAGRAPVVDMSGLDEPGGRERVFAQAMPLMADLTPERAAADGAAYLERLAEEAPGPAALTGYCMGGRIGWRIAAAHPGRVASLGAFHTAGLVTDAPDSPHLSASQLRSELYLGYADQDRNATPAQIAALDEALDEAGVTHTTELYPGAMHGYTMADTAAYDREADERHYAALFELLGRTLP